MYRISSEEFNIAKIADSGQCFRLVRVDGGFRLIALGRALSIVEDGNDCILDCSEAEGESLWHGYFDLDSDYAAFRSAVPDTDGYMKNAADFSRGIRILRQDPFEMLISFIISQRKSIPSIRTSVEALSTRFGSEIGEGIFAFPSPESLACAPSDALTACSLGYRTDYVHSAARAVADGAIDLGKLAGLSDEQLLDELLKLRGVGIKVAHCVSLFGYHRLDAFPRDVWINRVIDNEYHGDFSVEPYKGFAGVMQQYMFFYARSLKG